MRDLSSIFLASPEPQDALWELYHANTKLSPRSMPPPGLTADPVAELNASIRKTVIEEIEAAVGSGGKCYPTAPRIALPNQFPTTFGRPFEDVLAERASCRSYSGSAMKIEQLAALCLATSGYNSRRKQDRGMSSPARYVPSAGALYPLELYLFLLTPLGEVEKDRTAEIWHYEPREHCLERIARCRPSAMRACLQVWPPSPPPIVAFVTGVPKRQSWKYGARAYRYTLLEAGHAVQNFSLAATAMGLYSCPVVGFYDDVVHDLLDIDGVSEIVLYAVMVGEPSLDDVNNIIREPDL